MNSGIFNLNEISEVDMQADEDKDELGMDKIEELLESSAKSARWSDTKDKLVEDTPHDETQLSAKKRQRAESDDSKDENEHKKKKSKLDASPSEGAVVLTGNELTVRSSASLV